MNDQIKRMLKPAAAVVTVLVLLAFGTGWYLDTQRPAGDRNLAKSAVEGLTFIAAQYANADGPHEMYASGLRIHHEPVDLYLGSDSAARVPEVTPHIVRSWDAYLVADELWRLHEDGQSQPHVADVPGAAELIEQTPELAALVADDGTGGVVDNTDLRAVRVLFEVAARERADASAALAVLVEKSR